MASRGITPYAPLPPSEELGETVLHYENHTVADIYGRYDNMFKPEEVAAYRAMVTDLIANPPDSERSYQKCLAQLRKKFRPICPKKSMILAMYRKMLRAKEVSECEPLRTSLVTKAAKSQSGVLVITVLTSPTPQVGEKPAQNFSCKWDCHYCPDQPGQPRSYLRDEPAVRRANQNQFDPVLQFTDRACTLYHNGHPADKVELLVLGGTWHSYPLKYQEQFCRDLYYAANTFMLPQRPRGTLEEEQAANEHAPCKIIGLTLETRPDCINDLELRRLRRYGCTRVQLGMQHTDAGVLRHVNRGHDASDAAEALRLLKDACYKIDIHLMPNLPGSNPDMDKAMFDLVLNDEDYQADQWKIYPCEVLPWTRIERWHREGSYRPYDDATLARLIAVVKAAVHPWIRLNRIVRDIPTQYIVAGSAFSNLREIILADMKQQGTRCRCIRCREVGDIGGWQLGAERLGQGKRFGQREGAAATVRTREKSLEATLLTRQYRGNRADEYFISYEAPGEILCGFCRLRLSDRKYFPEGLFPELQGAALVRELHVYGQLIATAEKADNAQHVGFGTQMMAEAEDIAARHGYGKVAVIAGIGTRNYYRKLGYELEGEGGFMIKHFRDGTRLPVPPRGTLGPRLPPRPVYLRPEYRWALLLAALVVFLAQWLYAA